VRQNKGEKKMNKTLIAEWQAKRGKRFLRLWEDEGVYTYSGDGCGGTLPAMGRELEAIQYMELHAVAVLRSDFPSTYRIY
jgi:hypothetical protein